MSEQNIEHLGLVDFPLDPTPSLKAYKQFIAHIKQYIGIFQYNDGMISVGPVKLGRLGEQPCLTAPIEIDPRDIEGILRQTSDILRMAIGDAEQSIHWTRKIIHQTGTESSEAKGRIRFLESFVSNIEQILNKHKGFAWQTECYAYVSQLCSSSFVPGKPGIPIQITIFV